MKITDSHYFSVLLYPNSFISKNRYLTNSSNAYAKKYSSLLPNDFLLQNMVNGGNTTILESFTPEQLLSNRFFCYEAVKVRPIADILYFPLRVNGYLYGHCATARAGLSRKSVRSLQLPKFDAFNEPFSQNEIALISFLSGFIAEGIETAAEPPPAEEDTAYLNLHGRIVQSGQHIRDILKELCGPESWDNPVAGKTRGGKLLAEACRAFIHKPLSPGDNEVTVPFLNKTFRFVFSLLPQESMLRYLPNEPLVRVILKIDKYSIDHSKLQAAGRKLRDTYGLTPRELETVHCIYGGMSNGEISRILKISEETVKRHIYNAFSKIGVSSRTQLFFLITAD